MRRRPQTTTPATAGFTILEMTVVMGLLAGFALMLLQLISSSVKMFDAGESGQELADRADVATRAVEDTLRCLVGADVQARDADEPSTRLLVQSTSLGLVADGTPGAARALFLRASVRLPAAVERRLLEAKVRSDLEAEGVQRDFEQAVVQRLAETPRTGRGEMILVPWPARGEPGVFLELRRAMLLDGAELEPRPRNFVQLMDIDVPGGRSLPPEYVQQISEPIAEGLLHFELRFWSQFTRSWTARDRSGPEFVWDSARAGLLASGDDVRTRFTLDLGPDSLADTRDDVFPRAVQVAMVVGRGEGTAPPARLAGGISKTDTELVLTDEEAVPDDLDPPYVKVGSEWIRFSELRGRRLVGLRRGERGTAALAHEASTPVRIGKTVITTIDLPFGKDDWNGVR